jgi:SOUL heme-binding protein
VTATVREKLGPNGNSKAFPVLAAYIGVLSAPQNRGATAIAMTAPVVQTPTSPRAAAPQVPNNVGRPVSIAMTAPVVQTPTIAAGGTTETQGAGARGGAVKGAGAAFMAGDVSLAFLLPAEFTRVGQCPEPLDARVTLEEVGKDAALRKTSYQRVYRCSPLVRCI